jgi:hypothetical protein
MFIKFENKRASFNDGNLLVGYNQATLPEDPVVIDPPVIELLNFPINEFNDVGTVYNALYPDDQLILILRHGHRTDHETSDGNNYEKRLTIMGEAQCRLVGEKLKFNNYFPKDDSKYLSSDTDRTRNTCYNIMFQRGDELYTDKTEIPDDYEYNPRTEGMSTGLDDYTNILGSADYDSLPGRISTTGNDSWSRVSNYAFGLPKDGDAQTLLARKNEKDNMSHIFLNELISISDKKINIYASHDYKIIPLLSTFTGIEFDFQAQKPGFDISDNKYKDGKWLNYLSGLACVIHSDKVKEYIPVRGLSVGYSYSWPEDHDENWTGPDGENHDPNWTGPDDEFEWTPFLP